MFSFHKDISNLLYVYTGEKINEVQKLLDKIKIKIITVGDTEEPSLLYPQLPVEKCTSAERISIYGMSYKKLTPKQRYIYLKFLQNPYAPAPDFCLLLLLFGLERQMLIGDYEKAIQVLIKLLKHHKQKRFQRLAIRSLVVTCILYSCGQYLEDIDFTYADSEIFFLYAWDFKKVVTANDFVRYAKDLRLDKYNLRKIGDVKLSDVITVEQIKSHIPISIGFTNHSIYHDAIWFPHLPSNPFLLQYLKEKITGLNELSNPVKLN